MYYSATRKNWNLAIQDDVDVPWRHHAKWNKLDGETRIPYDPTYIYDLKKNPKLIDSENGLVVPIGEAWGVGEMGEWYTYSYKIKLLLLCMYADGCY